MNSVAASILGSFRASGRALGNPLYARFFAGQAVSQIGSWMQNVAQAWLVYRLTGSPALMGTVAFLWQFPILVLAPVGGALADRLDRVRILLVTQSLQLANAALLAALALAGRATVAELMALVTVSGIVSAFDMPARQALVPRLVAREQLSNAVALNSSLYNLASLVGPLVAGVVVARLGEGWCFAFNAASFIPAILVLATLGLPVRRGGAAGSVLGNAGAGLAYIWRTRPVRLLLSMIGVTSFAATPYFVLMPIVADKVLGGGPSMLGLLMACTGGGSFVACLVLAARRDLAGIAGMIGAAGLGFAVAMLLFALSSQVWLSALALAAAGFGWSTVLASANAVVQGLVPDEFRGRVMAGNGMMAVGTPPVASLLAGWAAASIGVAWTLALSGLLSGAAAGLFLRGVRGIGEKVSPPSLSAPSHTPAAPG